VEQYEKEKEVETKQGIIEPNENLLSQLVSFGVNELLAKNALIATKNVGIGEAFDYITQHEGDKPVVEETASQGEI
jgi:uncharacterized UBP type Zn finger protein